MARFRLAPPLELPDGGVELRCACNACGALGPLPFSERDEPDVEHTPECPHAPHRAGDFSPDPPKNELN